ncbi:MAG: hypothetical protein ACP5JU_01065 [Minisyncoccia bacterium]
MKIKSTLSKIGIFLLFLVIGFSFRILWFFFPQKEIMEYKFIEKPLREAKGGGKTPEETWINYLNALEKEDIEGALMYVWPENREGVRKTLERLREGGLIIKFAKNHSKGLIKNQTIQNTLEKDEQSFYYKYIKEKDIELFFVLNDPQLKKIEESHWEQKGLKSEPATFTIIFKYNPYTKTWFIK